MSLPKSVKIVSDGQARNTHVYDAETGREIDGVTRCDISVERQGMVDVRLQVLGAPIDICGKPTFIFNAMQEKAIRMIRRHLRDLDEIFAYRLDHYGHAGFVFEECSLSGLIGSLIQAVRKARRVKEEKINSIEAHKAKFEQKMKRLLDAAAEREQQLVAIAGTANIIKQNRRLAIELGLVEPF